MASPTGTTRATLDDLAKFDGKAELIGGRIVELMASGHLPSRVGARIYVALYQHEVQTGKGLAYTNGIGFAVEELASGRESFSPDVSFFTGAPPANRMRFVEGAPDFAVKVRSENDYGSAAEVEMAAKRDDYFAAGTQVVWDVDPQAEVIHVYRRDDPKCAATYRRGEVAEAEPAVPGWRLAVDQIFAPQP